MRILKSIGKALGVVFKLLFVGAVIVANFIMNCVGTLICAITDK